MKNKKLLFKMGLSAVGLIGSIVFIPWGIVWLWISPVPDTVQELVDNSIDHGFDGMIAYIDKKGNKPAFYAAGWKNRETKIPADPHALFKIASISKLYIAVAATKLVYNKSLSLDKSLAAYLPEMAGGIENANYITLKMLLQHRSGIPDFIDSPDLPWSNLPTNPEKFLKLVVDRPADFEPGSQQRYSNTNYLLIGKILDKTLGYSHHQYIKAEVLNTLNLSNTFGTLKQADQKYVVSGYYTGYNGDLKTQNYVVPGGSMVASAQDVGIFLRALNEGTLLNEDEQAIYSAVYDFEHTGLLPGYQSIARYHRDIDTVIVLFVNTSGGNSWTKMEIFYKRILGILRK